MNDKKPWNLHNPKASYHPFAQIDFVTLSIVYWKLKKNHFTNFVCPGVNQTGQDFSWQLTFY